MSVELAMRSFCVKLSERINERYEKQAKKIVNRFLLY